MNTKTKLTLLIVVFLCPLMLKSAFAGKYAAKAKTDIVQSGPYGFAYSVDENTKTLFITKAVNLNNFPPQGQLDSPPSRLFWMMNQKVQSIIDRDNSAHSHVQWNRAGTTGWDPYQAYSADEAAQARQRLIQSYSNLGYRVDSLIFIESDFQ